MKIRIAITLFVLNMIPFIHLIYKVRNFAIYLTLQYKVIYLSTCIFTNRDFVEGGKKNVYYIRICGNLIRSKTRLPANSLSAISDVFA
jgi:hypothetical protein